LDELESDIGTDWKYSIQRERELDLLSSEFADNKVITANVS